MSAGDCHKGKTSQGVQSCNTPDKTTSTRFVRKLAAYPAKDQPKNKNQKTKTRKKKKPTKFHFCKEFPKEIKIFQIIRKVSRSSSSLEQFNNEIKVTIASSFPFFSCFLQRFKRGVYPQNEEIKTTETQN